MSRAETGMEKLKTPVIGGALLLEAIGAAFAGKYQLHR